VLNPDEDVVEFHKELEEVFRQAMHPKLAHEARSQAATSTPVRKRGQGVELVCVVEDWEEEL
jgi:hypothetical protein